MMCHCLSYLDLGQRGDWSRHRLYIRPATLLIVDLNQSGMKMIQDVNDGCQQFVVGGPASQRHGRLV